MKQTKIVIFVLVWALALLVAICFIFSNYKGVFMNEIYFGIHIGTILQKEENISSGGIKKIEVDANYNSIELIASDRDDFYVTQYGRKNTPDKALFKSNKSDDKLTISTNTHFIINIGLNLCEEKLKIEVPKDWAGSVNLSTTSGNIDVLDEFTLEDFNLHASSGNIKIAKKICLNNLILKTSSGQIKIEGEINATGDIFAKSSSGSQIYGNIIARDISFEASSGKIANTETTALTLGIKSSSGSLVLGKINAETYNIGCKSGDIKIDGISGKGILQTSSGNISVLLMQPVGHLQAKSNSGNVKIKLPYELMFNFEGLTSCGNIKADFEVLFRSSKRNSSTAKIGLDPQININVKTSSGNIHVNRY